jgi:acetyl-CoA carboxylase biotin carboxylase subunit
LAGCVVEVASVRYSNAIDGAQVRLKRLVPARHDRLDAPVAGNVLIAKVIAYGETREVALAKMRNALDETIIDGIKTNIALHQDILRGATFQKGGSNIHYLEKWLNL